MTVALDAFALAPVLREFSARRKGNPQILADFEDFRVPATTGESQSASDVSAALNLREICAICGQSPDSRRNSRSFRLAAGP